MRAAAIRTASITAALLVLALTGCSGAAGTETEKAERHCLESGGEVQVRQPTWGTNNDQSSWVELGDPVTVCRFQAQDGSRIYADLVTLYSGNPTLAALAYLAKKPAPDAGGANPASALCAELGGAIAWGAGMNGGGLVNTEDPDDTVFAPCTFADGSFIDEWGIAYYSNGTVRGTDLTTVFRFDQSKLPAVF